MHTNRTNCTPPFWLRTWSSRNKKTCFCRAPLQCMARVGKKILESCLLISHTLSIKCGPLQKNPAHFVCMAFFSRSLCVCKIVDCRYETFCRLLKACQGLAEGKPFFAKKSTKCLSKSPFSQDSSTLCVHTSASRTYIQRRRRPPNPPPPSVRYHASPPRR